MRTDRLSKVPALAAGVALLAWFVYLVRGGLASWFSADDLMNMHIYWARPWPALLKANLAFWSTFYRPAGGLFYRPIFDLWGFHPLPFHIAALALLSVASNETTPDQTGPAVARVRGLDLSARPWDNSYMPPAQPGDVLEEHPYHFSDAGFKLARLAKANPTPWGARNGHGVIINEYGWLWLNRDGTPTTLTQRLYQNLLGPNSTTEQRRRLYARYLAAETEFWRAHRSAAAVMHFTTLGYSRPDGQTSDHWLDVKNLTWAPGF